VKKTIIKYITNSISASELEELKNGIELPKNEKAFKEFVKINYALDYVMKKYDTEKTKEQLLYKIRKDKSILYRQYTQKAFKYVAIALVFLTVGLLYRSNIFHQKAEDLVVEDEKIVLKLANGETRTINADETVAIHDNSGELLAEQEGEHLSYHANRNVKSVIYNELYIPYGKQFRLTLSDGTLVHLNSGSSLKYPVAFSDAEKRAVFLSGEAYFEVMENKEQPFVIHTGEIGAQVLGTQFNISSYPTDNKSNVVLVEGSVKLFKTDVGPNEIKKEIILQPGQKGEWVNSEVDFSVKSVNTYQYTSWRNGELVFRSSTFKHMLNVLERHYNVKIINTNKDLESILFNASFKKEPIGDVLTYFDDILQIDYIISNNTIIIQ